MAKKLAQDATIETLEDEIMYTIAALKADPDALDLEEKTRDWFPQVDALRAYDREVRQTLANADASRVVCNERLDMAVVEFGRSLLYEVDNDRSAPRWTGFFPEPPSAFIRKPLNDEVAAVQGWLGGPSDAILEAHRTALTETSAQAQAAVISSAGESSWRANLRARRAEVADALTSARDALYTELVLRAQERKLSRTWPDAFFRVEGRSRAA